MIINILKEKLRDGIGIVSKISQKSLTLPILQNILFKTEKNFLKLSTTNLESSITWWSLAKVDKEGQICIPTKFFSNLIGLLPNEQVSLEVKAFLLNIKCGNYEAKIKGLNPEDFPIIPKIKDAEVVKIGNKDFCNSLNKVLNIPSPSVTNPEISGIFLSFERDLIRVVATDSFRLAEKKIFIKTELKKDYSFILPQNAARELVGIFGEKDGDLKIYISPNQALFELSMVETDHPRIQFTSRFVDGEYPNYQEIIPKKYETKILAQKEDVLNQIKTASLFSGKVNEVKLSVNTDSNEVEVFSQSSDVGEHKSFFKSKIEGKKIDISFNHRFLIDGINEMTGKELSLGLTTQEGAAVLKSVGEEDYIYVIMPIKAG